MYIEVIQDHVGREKMEIVSVAISNQSFRSSNIK